MPQALVVQLAAEPPKDNVPAPEPFEAKVDSFFDILALPHIGHFTSLVALALRTNSSNGL